MERQWLAAVALQLSAASVEWMMHTMEEEVEQGWQPEARWVQWQFAALVSALVYF